MDSLQYEKHSTTIKIQILQNFLTIRNIRNILLQTIFQTAQSLSNTRCCCNEYYKYSQISPQHHTWLKIQNSITKSRDTTLAFLNLYQLYIFFLPCLHSTLSVLHTELIIYCCFGTSILSPWAKRTFLHMYFLQSVMEEEHSKGPAHNNPEEAAKYVRSVNSLLQSFVKNIHGFDHYKCLDAWETFLHTLSQLLSKLDSAYFTKMNTEVILDTIPGKACAAFLAHPEEAANRIQQRVSSDEIPTGPEVTSKMRLQENLPCFDQKEQQAVTKLFSHLQDTHNHMAEIAKAIVNVSQVSSPEQFTFVLQLVVRPIIQLKIPPHLSAPTELRFEKERLTPKEIAEENCCNLILP